MNRLKDNQLFNNIISIIRSARFRIILTIVILGVIPIIVMDYAINNFYRSSVINDRKSKLMTQVTVLAKDVGKYSDTSDASISQMKSALEQFSSIYDSRVLLVNRDYRIVYDSYSFEKNKTIIASNVIKAFNNNESGSYIDTDNDCIEVVVPVMNVNKDIFASIMVDMSSKEISVFVDEIISKVYIIKLILIILLVVGAIIFSAVICKPFNLIEEKVDKISQGYYDERLDVEHYTETMAISNDINQVLDKMHSLDESRQEFVSNVSHELKTPITSMKVLADSLNMQPDVPVEIYQDFMHDIVDEIDRESKIIEDLLSLVRMDKSANAMNISAVNINEVVELILKRLKPIAKKKNIELVFESYRPVIAEVDEVKFTLAVSNLVENAIKYNKVDGWVHVSLNADHQFMYIRVEDNGIGIPKENQGMVFERFYRVDKARSRETGGTGLGLAIVKNSILMHHGEIKLYSEENSGTTFTVRIPLNYAQEI